MPAQTLTAGANAAICEPARLTLTIDSSEPIDCAAYRLAADGRVRGDHDMIFYNQPRSDDGSIICHPGDCHSEYHLDLSRQPADIERIAIAFSGTAPLSRFRHLHLDIRENGTHTLHCPVACLGERQETALILGEYYRRNGAWKFRFIAQGFTGGLKPLSEHYGVEIADDDPTAGTPAANPLHNAAWQEDNSLANAAQHQPLADWFARKHIRARFNHAAVDMRGYYDEAAATLGAAHVLLNPLLNQINWAYRHRRDGLRHDLKPYTASDSKRLLAIVRALYDATMIARYHHDKAKHSLHIQLQGAQPVRQFLGGGWLEWYALGSLLNEAAKRGADYRFSCARGVHIEFANGDKHELDVAYLPPEKPPLIIECKSGEYRHDLDKHLNLRQRLDLPPSHYLILATDLDHAQANAFSAMYQLTFVTPDKLLPHCLPLV
ncbi:TerD family protein [uncultured Cardiobacterium sp.]|uniref:TerD family protein n=1 Tax=uncultured Cardiobacterium sp. TaxID=417619 RepID=UPI002621FA07|nr:TerD family protein [uncultured Cardiobacterium sp.]